MAQHLNDIDLEALSFDDLKALKKKCEAAIEARSPHHKQQALQAALKVANEYGFSLEELLETEAPKKKRTSSKMYQNPEDNSQIWVGLGRKPGWLQKLLDNGTQMQDLLIKQ